MAGMMMARLQRPYTFKMFAVALKRGKTDTVPTAQCASASDEHLMARVREGCEASFDALVRRHYGAVVNFATRMTGRPDLAPDVAQQVFAAIYAQRRRYRLGAPFRTWLYCIVRRECIRTRTREKREPLHTCDPSEQSRTHADPYDQAESKERLAAVARALLRLPERERAAVILFHCQQWSYAEIGAAIGCSAGAARTAACRGRARLRRLLAEYLEDKL